MNKMLVKVISFFKSGKAEAALTEAAKIATNPTVIATVQTIAAMTPTRADDEIVAVCVKYGVPVAQQYLATPQADRGHVLLQVAVKALTPILPATAKAVLTTAIDMAVLGAL